MLLLLLQLIHSPLTNHVVHNKAIKIGWGGHCLQGNCHCKSSMHVKFYFVSKMIRIPLLLMPCGVTFLQYITSWNM